MIKSAFLLLAVCATLALSFDDINLQVSVIEPSQVEIVGEHELETHEKPEDLCAEVKCDAGERCVINENEALCECIEHCELPRDERQQVCTTLNQTYESDCHFLRQKCWCNKNDAKCTDSAVLNDKLDYYGACRHIEQCSEEQKKVFPGRMKIWLDEVLHILDARKDLDPKFASLVKLADEMKANNVEKYWTAGVAFEFCQLDRSKDHQIQKEELKSLISSIKALENCIQPFLDECDANNDDMISDDEWATCLDLSATDLEMLRKYCDVQA